MFSKYRRSDNGIECVLRVNCFTDPKPLKKRHNRNGQKKVRKLDSILKKPSTSNDAIRVFFRPCMSAEHPQKYAPKSIPIQKYMVISFKKSSPDKKKRLNLFYILLNSCTWHIKRKKDTFIIWLLLQLDIKNIKNFSIDMLDKWFLKY